jgi:hypothetical protein
MPGRVSTRQKRYRYWHAETTFCASSSGKNMASIKFNWIPEKEAKGVGSASSESRSVPKTRLPWRYVIN